MYSYVLRPVSSTRPVVVAPYEPNDDNVLQPELPLDCPDRPAGGEACSVSVDHWRARKTGPGYPLMVARCSVHGGAFTVYPPGHFPYGRRALVSCPPNGGEPAGADRDWADTVFEGAVAGAAMEAWSREAEGGSNWWWSTQGRLMDLALSLTGTDPDLAQDLRHRIAETLRVPALVLFEQANRVGADPGFAARGRAVVAVLGQLAGGVVRRLLVVGQLVGLWGRPLWWDGVLRSIAAFPTSGTDPPIG